MIRQHVNLMVHDICLLVVVREPLDMAPKETHLRCPMGGKVLRKIIKLGMLGDRIRTMNKS